MDQRVKPTPSEILRARSKNPKMRERDLATQLGISEAEFVAAHCGEGAVRIEPRVADILNGLGAVGEVLALTRNESAVHEKIGVYDKVFAKGSGPAMVLGEQIDLRIFPKDWVHGFAVEKRDGEEIRRSLQFFDAHGEAVHKVHLRPASNLYAYQKLVGELKADDQSPTISVDPVLKLVSTDAVAAPVEELRERWSKLQDTHEFFGMLKSLNFGRQDAVRSVGEDYAWPLDAGAVTRLLEGVAEIQVPIMCFIGNRGCIQIHSGPVTNIKAMGPWINVLDETFHMHLRTDHIAEVWGVRKPTKDGHVTSVEAYDASGNMIIQFFGKRKEGQDERSEWRALAEALPRKTDAAA